MMTENMASSSMLSLAAILFFLVFAATDAAAAASVSAPAASLDAACATVEYPILCRKLIETYHPVSVQALMESAFQETISRLKQGKVKCDAINLLFSKNDTRKARDIMTCCNYYQEVGDELQKNVFAMIKKGDGDGVLSAGSNAASIVGSCYDMFDVNGEYGGTMEFPGSTIYYNLMKHVSNMVTLSCRAFPGLCPDRPTV